MFSKKVSSKILPKQVIKKIINNIVICLLLGLHKAFCVIPSNSLFIQHNSFYKESCGLITGENLKL